MVIDIIFLVIVSVIAILCLLYSIVALRTKPAEPYTQKGPTGPKGPTGITGNVGKPGKPGAPYQNPPGKVIAEYVYNPYFLSPSYYIDNYTNSAAIYQMVNVRELLSSSSWSEVPFIIRAENILVDQFPVYGIINTSISDTIGGNQGEVSKKNITQILYIGDYQFSRWYSGFRGDQAKWGAWNNIVDLG